MACTFKKRVRDGDRGEDLFAEVLESAGLPVTKNNEGKRADRARYDVASVVDGIHFTAEVKHDLYEAKSGNVAVEYHNSRSDIPSGILATEADLWVFVLSDGSVWAANTKALKDFFLKTPGLRDLPKAGDGNASIRLYRRHTLFDAVFVRLDLLNQPCLLTALKDRLN